MCILPKQTTKMNENTSWGIKKNTILTIQVAVGSFPYVH